MTETDGLTQRQENLLEALGGLVPLFQLEMRGWDFERRTAGLDIEAITSMSDVLMFAGVKPGKRDKGEAEASRHAFNTLARALAAMSYQPGGVTLGAGRPWMRHWCAQAHCACPTRPRAVCPEPCRPGCELRGDTPPPA